MKLISSACVYNNTLYIVSVLNFNELSRTKSKWLSSTQQKDKISENKNTIGSVETFTTSKETQQSCVMKILFNVG